MNEQPLASVIMTAYNAEKYIKESIDSILNQTYKNIELIIVLDGCTDNTEVEAENILIPYNGHFRVIKEKENKGCPTGRTIAINSARGKYILIQDADDISLLDRIEKQVNFMEENKDIFCVGGFASKIDENGEICGEMIYPPEKHREIVDEIVNRCVNPIIDPTTLFRTKDFFEVGGYSLDKNIYTVPDFDLWLRAILLGKKFYNIQEILTKYRVYDDSITRSKKDMMIRHHMIVWGKFKEAYSRKLGK